LKMQSIPTRNKPAKVYKEAWKTKGIRIG
jgi:hypothetical protein